jgi:hypothetical protein
MFYRKLLQGKGGLDELFYCNVFEAYNDYTKFKAYISGNNSNIGLISVNVFIISCLVQKPKQVQLLII